MKKTKKPLDRLCGYHLMFRGSMYRRQRPVGFYAGKIVQVTRGKRVPIRRILVERPNGDRVRLFPEEWTGDGLGIAWLCRTRKSVRAVAEFDQHLSEKEVAV